jgi:hypothetical protein
MTIRFAYSGIDKEMIREGIRKLAAYVNKHICDSSSPLWQPHTHTHTHTSTSNKEDVSMCVWVCICEYVLWVRWTQSNNNPNPQPHHSKSHSHQQLSVCLSPYIYIVYTQERERKNQMCFSKRCCIKYWTGKRINHCRLTKRWKSSIKNRVCCECCGIFTNETYSHIYDCFE